MTMWKTNKKTHKKFQPKGRKPIGIKSSDFSAGVENHRFKKRKDLAINNLSNINRKEFNDVIEMNKDICGLRPEICGYRRDFFNIVYDNIARHFSEPDSRKKVVNIANEIISGFVYQQPFSNANKTTGTVTMIDYLEKNGYTIDDNVLDQIADLGEKWNICYEDDRQKLYSDFYELLNKNVKPKV